MVLVSSYRSVSLAHFLPRTLDTFFFLELTHSFDLLSLCLTFWDMLIDYVHPSTLIMGLIFHSLIDSIFNPMLIIFTTKM